MTNSAASVWEAEIGAWARKLKAGGRRPQTIGLRTAHISMLGRWAQDRGPWDLGTGDLEAWTASKDWASSTRRSVRSSLRSFYTWGLTVRRIGWNPASDLASIKTMKPVPHPCDLDVLKAAVAAAPAREVLMIRLSAECGLRRGEVAQVHPRRDVQPDLLRSSLLVHGKGGKQRLIPLPEMLGAELARFARDEPGYLFPGRIEGHLSPAWVGRVVSRWLAEGWTMHSLRHFFATQTFWQTRNLLAVQQQLGHASPATTQDYIAPRLTDQQELVDYAAALLSA